MKKRIGVDFHVVDGMFQGSRTHVVSLFSRVIEISEDMEFFLFLDKPDALHEFSPVFGLPNVHLVRMASSNPVKRLCWQLPGLQRKYSLDLLHTQYIMPLPSLCPCVVTIHDVLFERYPRYFTLGFRLRSMALMRLSAGMSTHVFTVSEFSKKEIQAIYNVRADRITVIHNGLDASRFFPGPDGLGVVSKRGLTSRNYILSVGRLEPRKNHVSLLKAYAASGVDNLPLVIAGQRDFGYDEIFKTVDSLGLGNRVIFLHDVSDAELPALYRHAMLFVYPSVAEGFGLPVIEAMASGAPVITSNTTSIPEVAGDACILLDPFGVDGMARAIGALVNDEGLRLGLAKRGVERASLFRWEKSARNVRDVYLRLLADRGRDE